MKNHYDTMRVKDNLWAALKIKTRNRYDPTTNMFNFSDDRVEANVRSYY